MTGRATVSGDRAKTALITGATSGIGRETALALARHGFQVVIAGRRREAIERTAAWLKQQTGNPNIEMLIADLTSQADVRRIAHEFTATHRRLDVLINNAGGVFPRWALTADGVEQTWALNHLAPMLLSLELIGALRASGGARIINVASAAHKDGRIELGSQHDEAAFSMRAYSNAKLANVLTTYALARRLRGDNITVNTLHPGVVATSFGRSAGGWIGLLSRLVQPFLLTPDAGAAATVHVATTAELDGVTGAYFVRTKLGRSSPASYDESLQEAVWHASLQELDGAVERRRLIPGRTAAG